MHNMYSKVSSYSCHTVDGKKVQEHHHESEKSATKWKHVYIELDPSDGQYFYKLQENDDNVINGKCSISEIREFSKKFNHTEVV